MQQQNGHDLVLRKCSSRTNAGTNGYLRYPMVKRKRLTHPIKFHSVSKKLEFKIRGRAGKILTTTNNLYFILAVNILVRKRINE